METNVQGLSAAELVVLRDVNGASGREAFKLALTELIAKRVVRFHRISSKVLWVFTQHQDYVHVETDARGIVQLEADLRAAAEVVVHVSTEPNGATIASVVQRARQVFGSDLAKFKTEIVLPALIRKGYVESHQEKSLGIFSRTRYELTAKGQDAKRALEELSRRAQELPDMLSRNPTEAIALLGLLGSGFLLMPELRSQYQAIHQRLRDTGDVAGDFDAGDDADTPDIEGGGETGLVVPDIGEQLESAWGGLLDAFDGAMESFDNVLDSFDSSFDSADSSSDGGGDGGGGDGGGD